MSDPQDRIQTIYLCKSPNVSMFVFVFLEGGQKPRAIARIEWGRGPALFVEFPEMSWELLQERVERDIQAFSAQYKARVSAIHVPEGCSPERLMEWIRLGESEGIKASFGEDQTHLAN